MDYFDGTQEELKDSGWRQYGGTYTVGSFEFGSSRLGYSLNMLRLPALLILIMALILIGISLLIGAITGDTFIMMILLIMFSISMFLAFCLVAFIVFIVSYISTEELFGEARVNIVGDGIKVFFKRDLKLPQQLTYIPFQYFMNIHPVTKGEWENEMGMGSIFRKIIGSPRDNPNIRFHRGTSRKNIYTIQMSSDMPLKSLKMKTGVIGIMSLLFGLSLFAFYDQYIGANEGRSSRIFISLQYEKYNDFIILLDRTIRGQTDNVNNIQ